MQSEDAAENLLKQDDIAVSLIVDSIMGFRRRKLSDLDLPHATEDEENIIKKILESVKSKRNFATTTGQLLDCEWAREVTASMGLGKEEKKELESHLEKYLLGLTDEREFALVKTTRYAMEGYEGAKILAKKEVEKGKKIETLLGKTAAIREDQEEMLRNRGVDTSCIIKSQKSLLIVNGPVCFINHDCRPNCQFYRLPSGDICFVAKRKIKLDEELTMDYGAGYFGRNQKNCQCQTCESGKMGAYRKLKPGERRDRDLWTPEEENKIVKVCLSIFLITFLFNILIFHLFQYLLKNGGYSRRQGILLWKEMESKNILEDRSWKAIKGRFMKHTLGSLKDFKVTEEMLVAAHEKAKTERLAATGHTWSNLQHFLRDEDEEILEYIVEKKQFSRVGGKALFKEMAAEKAVDGRTWKSLQHRFRNHIMENLELYNLTDAQRTFLRERTVVLDEEGKLAAGQTRSYQKFTVTDDKAMLEFIVKNNAYARVGNHAFFMEMAAAEGVGEGRNCASLWNRFHKYIIKDIGSYGLTSEQVSFFKNRTIIKDADGQIADGQTRANTRYSPAEDKMILHDIAKADAYNKVGGNRLWKKMEKRKVVGDRTWQSIKKRFSRTLIKNIEKKSNTYDLDEEQVSLFINRGEDEESDNEKEEDEDMEEDEKMEEETTGPDEARMEAGEEMEVDEADMEEIEEFYPARILANFE